MENEMATKTAKKIVAKMPQATIPPTQPTVKRVRRVETITDELYKWIKTGIDKSAV
jgi:hypothetical protein